MPVKKIKVLMATAELAPFAKVGGLGDVTASLPLAIKKLGVDARVIMPLYGSVDRKKYKLKKIYSDLEIPSGRVMIKINIWQSFLPGSKVLVYFIDAPDYFKYGDVYAPGDNSERFLFFSYASLFCLPAIKFQPDIVHCHDSHTALIPDMLKVSNFEYLENIKTLYTIHNFRYQGKTRPLALRTGNLHKNSLKVLTRDVSNGDINFMVQGVLNADLINTVSPTYAREITTSAYGATLERIIKKRKDDLYGIINGIDMDFFNPAKDKYISENYSCRSVNKKIKNKLALQKRLGLSEDKDKAVVGLVSRLAWQKGIDLITDEFAKLNCQFVFLGTGDKKYEEHLIKFAKNNSKQISAQIKFEIKLAQEIYAGSDIFLMPSRFEPCGLGQMIAMRYGTIPVARATGGLVDTINEKNGFLFKNVDSEEFYNCLKGTLDIYYNKKDKWREIQKNGMMADFSWNRSAKEYLKLYKKLKIKNQ
ncbi:glycogen synthase, partial [Candidatus Parcubacteria bacterium]|nr:glycogen synthase [Candidatus Parcubacteria bacterium]